MFTHWRWFQSWYWCCCSDCSTGTKRVESASSTLILGFALICFLHSGSVWTGKNNRNIRFKYFYFTKILILNIPHRYRRALRWHDGSVDAIVFRPAEGLIVTGSEDRFMKVRLLKEEKRFKLKFNLLQGVEDWELGGGCQEHRGETIAHGVERKQQHAHQPHLD